MLAIDRLKVSSGGCVKLAIAGFELRTLEPDHMLQGNHSYSSYQSSAFD